MHIPNLGDQAEEAELLLRCLKALLRYLTGIGIQLSDLRYDAARERHCHDETAASPHGSIWDQFTAISAVDFLQFRIRHHVSMWAAGARQVNWSPHATR
jgi:hypothetical protein